MKKGTHKQQEGGKEERDHGMTRRLEKKGQKRERAREQSHDGRGSLSEALEDIERLARINNDRRNGGRSREETLFHL